MWAQIHRRAFSEWRLGEHFHVAIVPTGRRPLLCRLRSRAVHYLLTMNSEVAQIGLRSAVRVNHCRLPGQCRCSLDRRDWSRVRFAYRRETRHPVHCVDHIKGHCGQRYRSGDGRIRHCPSPDFRPASFLMSFFLDRLYGSSSRAFSEF